MVLMEKENALTAALTFLDKLLGVFLIDNPGTLSALIEIVRSGAEKAQVLEMLDRIMLYEAAQNSSVVLVSGNPGNEMEPNSTITNLAPDG